MTSCNKWQFPYMGSDASDKPWYWYICSLAMCLNLILSYFHSNRPVDVKRGNAIQAKTTARYPVRSGPKQFASYLNDMGSLILEILSGAMMVSVGTAEIPGIGQLSPTRSIVGFFPIVSPTDEKIGDLHVALVIESLMGRHFFLFNTSKHCLEFLPLRNTMLI